MLPGPFPIDVGSKAKTPIRRSFYSHGAGRQEENLEVLDGQPQSGLIARVISVCRETHAERSQVLLCETSFRNSRKFVFAGGPERRGNDFDHQASTQGVATLSTEEAEERG